MSFKGAVKKTWRETKGYLVTSKFLCLLVNLNIQNKDKHSKTMKYIGLLKKINNPFAYLYLAELNFFYARYLWSLKAINVFLDRYPKHVDGVLLKSQILYCINNKEEAWLILEKLSQVSHRVKIWLAMEKLIESPSDFSRMEQLFLKSRNKYKKSDKIIVYLIKAAIKAKEYAKAKQLLQAILLADKTSNKSKTSKKSLSKNDAKIALRDLNYFFNKHNMSFFLVSGTFLGCIRDNEILSHDYDIDVGLFECNIKCDIAKLICREGVFCIHEFNTPGIFKLKHINGVLIDVFIHYKEEDKVYHPGLKTKWYNSDFSLKEYLFLGGKYLGPSNADLYLTENYGSNWREPKILFDNILDTPNAIVSNNDEFILHLYELLTNQYGISNKTRILHELNKMGENNFVAKYASIKK